MLINRPQLSSFVLPHDPVIQKSSPNSSGTLCSHLLAMQTLVPVMNPQLDCTAIMMSPCIFSTINVGQKKSHVYHTSAQVCYATVVDLVVMIIQ